MDVCGLKRNLGPEGEQRDGSGRAMDVKSDT